MQRIAYFIYRSICGAANIQMLNWSGKCGGAASLHICALNLYSTVCMLWMNTRVRSKTARVRITSPIFNVLY